MIWTLCAAVFKRVPMALVVVGIAVIAGWHLLPLLAAGFVLVAAFERLLLHQRISDLEDERDELAAMDTYCRRLAGEQPIQATATVLTSVGHVPVIGRPPAALTMAPERDHYAMALRARGDLPRPCEVEPCRRGERVAQIADLLIAGAMAVIGWTPRFLLAPVAWLWAIYDDHKEAVASLRRGRHAARGGETRIARSDYAGGRHRVGEVEPLTGEHADAYNAAALRRVDSGSRLLHLDPDWHVSTAEWKAFELELFNNSNLIGAAR